MTDTADLWSAEARELIRRALALLPMGQSVDWSKSGAAQWRSAGWVHHFRAATELPSIELDDLHGIDVQKSKLIANTAQFVRGFPANNALLWGARGTGKSSLVHALANAHRADGLRLVEVNRVDLQGIGELGAALGAEPYRFIVFCDDLSFEADDAGYKALKSALEGSLLRANGNVLIYATSNRRHLLPERMSDNLDARHVEGELHESEAVEEKVSLSDRFGLWLSFYPFKQDAYLDVARHWTRKLGQEHGVAMTEEELDSETFAKAAATWALARGGRSGRSAQHFARDWVGKALMRSTP